MTHEALDNLRKLVTSSQNINPLMAGKNFDFLSEKKKIPFQNQNKGVYVSLSKQYSSSKSHKVSRGSSHVRKPFESSYSHTS